MLGNLLNSSAVVAFITTMGTIIVGLGVVILKRRTSKPKDPMEIILNHQDAFIKRLLSQNAKLSDQLDALEDELFKTKELLMQVRRDLHDSTQSNHELQTKLTQFKQQYGLTT